MKVRTASFALEVGALVLAEDLPVALLDAALETWLRLVQEHARKAPRQVVPVPSRFLRLARDLRMLDPVGYQEMSGLVRCHSRPAGSQGLVLPRDSHVGAHLDRNFRDEGWESLTKTHWPPTHLGGRREAAVRQPENTA